MTKLNNIFDGIMFFDPNEKPKIFHVDKELDKKDMEKMNLVAKVLVKDNKYPDITNKEEAELYILEVSTVYNLIKENEKLAKNNDKFEYEFPEEVRKEVEGEYKYINNLMKLYSNDKDTSHEHSERVLLQLLDDLNDENEALASDNASLREQLALYKKHESSPSELKSDENHLPSDSNTDYNNDTDNESENYKSEQVENLDKLSILLGKLPNMYKPKSNKKSDGLKDKAKSKLDGFKNRTLDKVHALTYNPYKDYENYPELSEYNTNHKHVKNIAKIALGALGTVTILHFIRKK